MVGLNRFMAAAIAVISRHSMIRPAPAGRNPRGRYLHKIAPPAASPEPAAAMISSTWKPLLGPKMASYRTDCHQDRPPIRAAISMFLDQQRTAFARCVDGGLLGGSW